MTAIHEAAAAGVPRFVFVSAHIPNVPGLGGCAGGRGALVDKGHYPTGVRALNHCRDWMGRRTGVGSILCCCGVASGWGDGNHVHVVLWLNTALLPRGGLALGASSV